MQQYVSDELFHFVGRRLSSDEDRYQLLVAIIRGKVLRDPRYGSKRDFDFFFFDVVDKNGSTTRHGFRPEPYFEVRVNGPIEDNEFVAPEMVCFCDIPVSALELHARKYSRFGIGFKKDFLVRQGANPVMYVAKTAGTPLRLRSDCACHADFFVQDGDDGILASSLERGAFLEKLKARTFELSESYKKALQREFLEYRREKDDPVDLRRRLLTHVEFTTGSFCYLFGLLKTFDPALPDDDPNNYYMEREWRVIGQVNFDQSDVSTIVVPAEYMERLRSEMRDIQCRLHSLRA